jgi:hypothetical protein
VRQKWGKAGIVIDIALRLLAISGGGRVGATARSGKVLLRK